MDKSQEVVAGISVTVLEDIVALIVILLIIGVTVYLTRNSKKFFEDAEDRDNTLLMIKVFALFASYLILFRHQLTAEVIAGFGGTILGMLLSMVNSKYGKGKNGSSFSGKDQGDGGGKEKATA